MSNTYTLSNCQRVVLSHDVGIFIAILVLPALFRYILNQVIQRQNINSNRYILTDEKPSRVTLIKLIYN